MRIRMIPVGLVVLAALTLPSLAFGHAERASFYPDFTKGSVPKYRTTGPSLVVCKGDTRNRIVNRLSGKMEKRNLALLEQCRYRDIQAAVNAAKNSTRILVLPGIYKEEPSQAIPDDYSQVDGCKDKTADREGNKVLTYEGTVACPNVQNLIAILGDGPDADRICDRKCNIQIEGTARAKDVLITGDQRKLNVIRADRADGVYLKNFTIQYSDFNNIYALETNGFVFDGIVSRWSREYGFLSFTSDNGLYKNLRAFGSGDSGIYPGSGPEGHCKRYGIEIRDSKSYDNNLGYSGTAGNGVWAHDNEFFNNGTGIVTDSFASGHPGMPQDCAKWENNKIYSNNKDLFNAKMDEYCKKPYRERNPRIVCPTFQNPVGTGILIAGGNGNIVRNNWIWDNWRQGVGLFHVPAALRGEDDTGQSANDPAKPIDTSFDNKFTGNKVGFRPDGTRDPNGLDFWWNTQGKGNCWENNTPAQGRRVLSDPPNLPTCPGSSIELPGEPQKYVQLAPCATWNPKDNTDPPGCDWFTLPPEPR
jgi:hypothetical protein